jgi:hypothetical protein
MTSALLNVASVHDLEILEMNRFASSEYCHHRRKAGRTRYRNKHRTIIVVFKCMDGRLDFSVITRTPVGIIQGERNIGGMFDLGWPSLRTRMVECVKYASAHGMKVVFIVAYHFSVNDMSRGCAGHDHKVGDALRCAQRFAGQLASAFPHSARVLLVGIETDADALCLHTPEHLVIPMVPRDKETYLSRLQKNIYIEAEGLEQYRVQPLGYCGVSHLHAIIHECFNGYLEGVEDDIVSPFARNMQHVDAVFRSGRPVESPAHQERVILIGRGWDWMRTRNYALILHDDNPRLDMAVEKAVRIIYKNQEQGRVPKEPIPIYTAIPYDEYREAAIQQARFIDACAQEVVRTQTIRTAHSRYGVTNWENRRYDFVEAI